MDVRRRVFIAIMLVVVGAGLGWFVVVPQIRRPARKGQQVLQDAITLTQLLRYDFRIEDSKPIDEAWNKRRPLYDETMFRELRDDLTAFVEFQVAEYADAKDIYVSGRRPDESSDTARAAQEALRAAFGAEADVMIAQYAQRVRESAYKASPRVGGGLDPAMPRYDAIYDDVVTKWLPQAKARIRELTSPLQ